MSFHGILLAMAESSEVLLQTGDDDTGNKGKGHEQNLTC